MRSLGTLLCLCFGLAVFAAGEARAFPVSPGTDCDEDAREGQTALVPPAGAAFEAFEALGDDLVEAILPCGMLESGAVGPWCLDASVYVLTQSGVLLCRTGLTAFELPSGGTPLLERALPPTGSMPSGADAFALTAPLLPALPAPLLFELPTALEGRHRPDRPFSPAPPFVPG